MERFSVKLWTALNHVIGTQEAIQVRRRCDLLSNKINNSVFKNIKAMLSGSRCEGLNFKHSDFDLMVVRVDLSFAGATDYESERDSDIVMEMDNVKPGFVRLRCKNRLRYEEEIGSALVEIKGRLYLSSALYRDIFLSQYKVNTPDAFAHGPCVTFDIMTEMSTGLDVLHCIASKSMPPNLLSEWVNRKRKNNWPSRDLITKILDDGCILVPVGDSNSDQYFMEWRLSFSVAEKNLVHSINHTQLLCYGLLKLYLKHVINSNDNIKDLLCSYFLKTSLFYCIEEENISWRKENIFDCFLTCFRKLIYWVREGYCPNYFVKQNNMFEGKICGEKQKTLLCHLNQLYHDGISRLRMIPCLSELFGDEKVSRECELCPKEWYFDMELNHKVITAQREEKLEQCLEKMTILSKWLNQTTTYIDRIILTQFYDRKYCLFIQYLYHNITLHGSNKTRYKEIQGLRRCISMIGDRCTRMLLFATLSYLNGEYTYVLTISEKVLRDHGEFLTLCYYVQSYKEQICHKKLTFQQKRKSGLFSALQFFLLDCKLYPQEIAEVFQTCEFSSNIVRVPTAFYANILIFLSYHQLGCKERMNFFLKELHKKLHSGLYYESIKKISKSLFEKCQQLAPELDTHMCLRCKQIPR